MKTKEFNLSDLIHKERILDVEDVKEFIKQLKEELFGNAMPPTDNGAIEIIDKLAGKDLV